MNLGTVIRYVVGGAILCLLLFCLCSIQGCATKKPMAAPQKTHIERNDSVEKLYIHDTTYIDRWHTRWQSGDTVYIHDSIFFYQGKEKGDTIYIRKNTTDTVPQIVEKQLSGRQTFLIRSGVALWIILALFIVAMIIGIVIKFAK